MVNLLVCPLPLSPYSPHVTVRVGQRHSINPYHHPFLLRQNDFFPSGCPLAQLPKDMICKEIHLSSTYFVDYVQAGGMVTVTLMFKAPSMINIFTEPSREGGRKDLFSRGVHGCRLMSAIHRVSATLLRPSCCI